jgi:DNA-binding transcriptional ArsR family regulator
VPAIADIGFAISHQTRVHALEALMSGKMLPNGELARICGVVPSSMSEHLAVLLRVGLVSALRSGRHRYYAIASNEAAALVEATGLLAQPPPARNLHSSERSKLERAARMCYNHLAGSLGVALLRSLIERGALELRGDGALVKPGGACVLAELGATRVSAGSILPCCVDYSERAFHLRGPAAIAIASAFLSRKWVRRGPGRSLVVTPEGRSALSGMLPAPGLG